MPLQEEEMDNTAFTFHAGTYRSKQILSWLQNTTATFQRELKILLSQYRLQTCLVYIDDVIIFSPSDAQHLQYVRKLLEAPDACDVMLKQRKFELFTPHGMYLAHKIAQA